LKPLEIDVTKVQNSLIHFISEYTRLQGFDRVVIGLSGGLDSSVCAHLAVEALGKENVVGVFLPHQKSNPHSLTDAQSVAIHLGIQSWLIDVTPMVQPYQEHFPGMDQVQLGNVMARCRMILLYQISSIERALVLGTSNKSELLLGYGTLYGDLACAYDPIGNLYKTQVRALARSLGVSQKIIDKAPSADLWAGQSDEGELGFTYSEADRFLVCWIDEKLNRAELLQEGFTADFIDRITTRVIHNQFKRTSPPIPKFSDQSDGYDLVNPQDWMK